MNKIIFPRKSNQRYYDIHYQYIRDLFEIEGYQVEESDGLETSALSFKAIVDDNEVRFDYSDSGDEVIEPSEIPVFKFHYRNEHRVIRNVYPFSPISFYLRQWVKMERYRKEIKYNIHGEKILNNQRPYGNATIRRALVQRILMQNYSNAVEIKILEQEEYFFRINEALVHVFIPGQNENMLDRGQFQFMALGCPTISTHIPEILPYYEEIKPFVHYIEIKNDFSDLTGAISFSKQFRKDIKKYGNQAARLFERTSTPNRLIQWIGECIDTCRNG